MEILDFNPSALESLTERIENNLKNRTTEGEKEPKLAKPKLEKKKNKIKSSTEGGNKAVEPIGKDIKRPSLEDRETHLKGKKRLRDGQIKGPEGQKLATKGKASGFINGKAQENKTLNHKDTYKSSPSSGHAGSYHQSASNKNRAKSKTMRPKIELVEQLDLQKDVVALGGTEEDLALIEGVISESEVEASDTKTMNGKLMNDLHRTIKELGISEVREGDDNLIISNKYERSVFEEPEPASSLKKPGLISQASQQGLVNKHTSAGGGSHSHLTFEPQVQWFMVRLPSIIVGSRSSLKHPPRELIDRVHQYAKSLLGNENKKYAARNGSSSAQQFYSTIMSSGTLSDKISALTLSVQESPLHNMRALESLVGLAKKRSRGQAVDVLGALKDLLGPGSLLPPDRKLNIFAAHAELAVCYTAKHANWQSGDPLPQPLEEVHLISWAYEDWLKSMYFEVLKILETWCNDEVTFARGKAVDYVYELLRDKPEQEANLLRLLVNKLGDSDKKIASKTSYNILQLQTTHPLMKPLIISSIESDLIFRPGQSLQAKYYAIITLNQTVLSGKEEAVAKKLLEIYFSLFVTLLAKPESVKPALSAADAVAINRNGERQGGGGTAGKKALRKLASQTKDTSAEEELREKMLSAVLTGVNRALPFTKADEDAFEKHLDTLFRVTHSSNFNTSIQALMLIQQMCGSHLGSADRFYRTLYESLLDPRLLTSSKQAMYLNLLFRALRSDLKVKRVKAFAKRLLQVVAMHQASFTCGVMYLIRELESVFANLQVFIDQPEENESDEEEFHDVHEDTEDVPQRSTRSEVQNGRPLNLYDGKKRDPEHSSADKSCLWELTVFLTHFHPSVSLFASKLISHEIMPSKPDLATHTLIHFLDRFVYRNPKKTAGGLKGASIMQPLAGGDTSGLLVAARSKKGAQVPVNTEAFWKMEGGKVNADEAFFHKYFNTMGRGKEQAKKKKVKEKASEDEASEGEEGEEEIWKALVDSRPEIEGSDQSGGDLGMDDLESALEGSDHGVEKEDFADTDEENMEFGEDNLDFADDDGALLDSDDEVPSYLDSAFKDEMHFHADKTAPAHEEKRDKKRRRLKNLPTFASADDYAAMLTGDDVDE